MVQVVCERDLEYPMVPEGKEKLRKKNPTDRRVNLKKLQGQS